MSYYTPLAFNGEAGSLYPTGADTIKATYYVNAINELIERIACTTHITVGWVETNLTDNHLYGTLNIDGRDVRIELPVTLDVSMLTAAFAEEMLCEADEVECSMDAADIFDSVWTGKTTGKEDTNDPMVMQQFMCVVTDITLSIIQADGEHYANLLKLFAAAKAL